MHTWIQLLYYPTFLLKLVRLFFLVLRIMTGWHHNRRAESWNQYHSVPTSLNSWVGYILKKHPGTWIGGDGKENGIPWALRRQKFCRSQKQLASKTSHPGAIANIAFSWCLRIFCVHGDPTENFLLVSRSFMLYFLYPKLQSIFLQPQGAEPRSGKRKLHKNHGSLLLGKAPNMLWRRCSCQLVSPTLSDCDILWNANTFASFILQVSTRVGIIIYAIWYCKNFSTEMAKNSTITHGQMHGITRVSNLSMYPYARLALRFPRQRPLGF